MDYATCARTRASRVIVSILWPIDLGFSIGNFNRGIFTIGRKARIIRSIAASETSENSRTMPGSGEMCSEADLEVRFTKKRSEKQNGAKVCYTSPHVQQNRILKMSCRQLTDKHHASVAAYVGEKMGFSWDKTVTLADKLKRVNIQGVNYRYDQKKPARKCNMENRIQLDQHGFYDAIRCWAYQSCDNPGNLDYDILVAFLFDLVPDDFDTDMPINTWGIY